jgi:hypothetical protein
MPNDQNASVPAPSGSLADGGPDENSLFADVFANSVMLQGEAAPLNEDDTSQEDSGDDNLEDPDDADNDDDEDGKIPDDDSENDDDDADEASTEEEDDDSDETAGDIDWDFEVPIKVDGEDLNVSLEEMKKGYSTQKHLSKQGRELGDERKAFETERTEKMDALVATSDILIAQTTQAEKGLATKYNKLTEEYNKLKEDGDKFGANDKRDEIQDIQTEYWKARKGRESLEENIKAAKDSDVKEAFNLRVKEFAVDIVELIPDFDADRATLIREFALEQGISEELLNSIANAPAVKLLDDFRLLKGASVKGAAKKKTITRKKSTPMKRPTSAKTLKQKNDSTLSRKIASGEASEDEGFDLLRTMAAKHF